MIMNFNSFNDLLSYCKTCLICKNQCHVSFELTETPSNWFDLLSSNINDNNVLNFCGLIFNNVSEDDKPNYSTFDLLIPIDSGQFTVDADFFTDSFEFFIEVWCNHCKARRVSTENIIVDKNGLSNFNVETETIMTDNFDLEINHEEETIDVYSNERKFATFEFSKFIDLTDLKNLDVKLQKYLLIS